jgi:hypothetical protein
MRSSSPRMARLRAEGETPSLLAARVKAAFLRDRKKRRQHAQLVLDHL